MFDVNATEDRLMAFEIGRDSALAFRADPYRDLYQDVFKAETVDYKLSVGYDDVNGETILTVVFKRPNYNACHRRAEMVFSSSREALERAVRFVAEHPAPRPRCYVDY
jgi:hypothetical protein